MTPANLATVFVPCLLPPPNKAEMSEVRLELRVLVIRAFIENPHLFGNTNYLVLMLCLKLRVLIISTAIGSSLYLLGVIPKDVMDSMDFLMNLRLPSVAKRGHKRRQGFKGKNKIYFKSEKHS